jgi:hypothetical protein
VPTLCEGEPTVNDATAMARPPPPCAVATYEPSARTGSVTDHVPFETGIALFEYAVPPPLVTYSEMLLKFSAEPVKVAAAPEATFATWSIVTATVALF